MLEPRYLGCYEVQYEPANPEQIATWQSSGFPLNNEAFRWEAMSASLAGTCCGVVATSDDGTVIGIPCQPAACSRGLEASRIPGVVNDLAGWRELPAVEANPCLNTKPLNV